jgi:hypothetical protein
MPIEAPITYTPSSIISLDDAKTHLRISTTDAARDAELGLYLAATTSIIEDEIGLVVPRSCVELLGALNSIVLTNSPAISVTAIVTNDGADLTSYFALNGPAGMLSINPTVIGYPFAARPYNYPGQPLDRLYYQGLLPFYPGQPLTVTYVAGRSNIPGAVLLAARLVLSDLWSARRGAMPLPARGGGDSEIPVRGYQLPDDAVALLATMPRAPTVA